MASNPMQRQKRVSFLLGVLTMLIIAAIVIALLFMQLMKLKKEQEEALAALTDVYIVTEDVASGNGLQISAIEGDPNRTSANVSEDTADSKVVPANIAVPSDFQDENGNARSDIVAKINLSAGTILTKDMLTVSSETLTDDLRKQEYNMLSLPVDLVDGDYVDVRMRLSNGQDFIIVSKKEVSIPSIAGAPVNGTITINLAEEETLAMSCAIVEAYKANGIELYVSRYTDPGMQVAATPTYPVSAESLNLMDSNPNIVDEAKQAIASRYNRNLRENYINGQINSVDGDERKSNLESSVEQHITQQKELRQQYLQSLEDAAAAADAAATSTTTNTTSTGTSN